MSWLIHLLRPQSDLPPSIVQRIDAWRDLPAVSETEPLDSARLVVVDVETSGLNPRRDRLLSVGAVSVDSMRLAPRHTFSAVLRNVAPSTRENILVHGLTPTAQAAGEPPEQALVEFLEFIGKAPCIAFHARFDRLVLERALRATLGVRLPNVWLDIAHLAPALMPEAHLPQGALDDWLAHCRLTVHVRHNAVHDAQVASELFLILLARASARGITTFAELNALAHKHSRTTTGA